MNQASEQATKILEAVGAGDERAAEKLLPLVYNELRHLAAAKLAQEASGQTLQPTALVHEAWLRLIGPGNEHWNSRGHFFGAAAEAMRRILIDRARRKHTPKHGGDRQRQELDALAAPPADENLLALDAALEKLTASDPLKAKLVELRFFVGLTGEQAAAVLGIAPATADRYWRYLRAWLQTEIQGG